MKNPKPKKTLPRTNPLIDSQIFRRIGKNNLIKIVPEKILFTGFQPNQPMDKIVKILNISSQRQRFHILPPQSEFFKIDYKKKQGPHVPGMSIPVTVTFRPSAWKTYTDCIRIHCPEGEDNLIIPLHAYPSVDTSSVPRRIDFNNVKLGALVTRRFTIWSKSDLDIKYHANLKEGDTGSVCFKLHPSGEGIIPSGNSLEFKVVYNPKEYCTKMTSMKLVIDCGSSEVDSPALIVDISGNCKSPELADVLDVTEGRLRKSAGFRARRLPEIKKGKGSKAPTKVTKDHSKASLKNNQDVSPNRNFSTGGSITRPKTIHTQHGVNKLLLHGIKNSSNYITHSFQPVEHQQFSEYKTDESEFLSMLNINKKLESSCRVKWLERKGQVALGSSEKADIIDKRKKMIKQETYTVVKEDQNGKLNYLQGRIKRPANNDERTTITKDQEKEVFSIYDSNDWWKRRYTRSKFKITANKIIYRNRADRVIKIIKLLAEERILKAKILEEERLELERLTKSKDPLQELLDRLIPIEDERTSADTRESSFQQNITTELAHDSRPKLGSSLEKFQSKNSIDEEVVDENEINRKIKELEAVELAKDFNRELLANPDKTGEVLDKVLHEL